MRFKYPMMIVATVALTAALLTLCHGADDSSWQTVSPEETAGLSRSRLGLHPAFCITAGEAAEAVLKGSEDSKAGRRTPESAVWYPRWIDPKKEMSQSVRIVGLWMSEGTIQSDANDDLSAGRPVNIDRRITMRGYFLNNLSLLVQLYSLNSPRGSKKPTAPASAGDVRVTKFVLSDDNGVEIVADPVYTKIAKGPINKRCQGEGFAFYSPWTPVSRQYSASYEPAFPLFTADGRPLIKSDVKKLRLKIFTENGEMDATYAVPKGLSDGEELITRIPSDCARPLSGPILLPESDQ